MDPWCVLASSEDEEALPISPFLYPQREEASSGPEKLARLWTVPFCVAGSGRVASSSVGGVFLFLLSPVDFLARLFGFLAISEKRGITSVKEENSLL